MGLARARDARALEWALEDPGALATRSPRARTALLRAFGRGALPALGEALEGDHLDPRLERAIVETLGLARRTAAAAAIARRLLSPDPEIRVSAARALGRLGMPDCAPALLAALKDEAWQVRAQAARALGRLRLADAIPQLSACLTDRSWWVRRHAAYALSGIGDEGFAALRGAAENSPDPYARDIALEALEHGLPGPA
jgi:HEAT repeat protein